MSEKLIERVQPTLDSADVQLILLSLSFTAGMMCGNSFDNQVLLFKQFEAVFVRQNEKKFSALQKQLITLANAGFSDLKVAGIDSAGNITGELCEHCECSSGDTCCYCHEIIP